MQPARPGIPNLTRGGLHAIGLTCALAACGISYLMVYKPLTDWRGDVERRAEVVKAQLADSPRVRRGHAETSRQLDELLASVESIGQRVPERPREGEFLGDLSGIAGEHDVLIDDFRRGAVAETPTHSSVSVTVEGKGSYLGFCGLLDAVARLSRLASLAQLHIKPSTDDDQYAIELHYLLYYGLNTSEATEATASR